MEQIWRARGSCRLRERLSMLYCIFDCSIAHQLPVTESVHGSRRIPAAFGHCLQQQQARMRRRALLLSRTRGETIARLIMQHAVFLVTAPRNEHREQCFAATPVLFSMSRSFKHISAGRERERENSVGVMCGVELKAFSWALIGWMVLLFDVITAQVGEL